MRLNFKHPAIAIIALASFAMCGCNFRVMRDPDVLVFAMPAEPAILNPILGQDAGSSMVGQQVFDSLLRTNPETLELEPRLAARWEISPDHLTYTYWLRDGVKWHDGKNFSVDDVVYTFECLRNLKVDSPLKSYFKDLKRIEKIPPNGVKFVFDKPYFKTDYAVGSVSIIPKHVFDGGGDLNSHRANRAPIGTGPYKFVEWKSGRHVKIARFDDYWGTKPKIAGMTFTIIPDASVKFQLLKKGAIDFSHLLPIQWAKETEDKEFAEKFVKHRYWLPNAAFIAWNMRRPIFQDRRVRMALTMLVNRRKIVEKILFGEGMVVPTEFYLFGADFDKTIEPYPYDPEEAKRLLDEAGWRDSDGDGIRDRGGVPFRFNFLYAAGDPVLKTLGILLREDLMKAGIAVDSTQLEWATMLGKLRQRDFDAISLSFANPLKYDPFSLWHSSQSKDGTNLGGFSNAEADRLMETARMEFDPAKRAELFKKLQAIIHREEPYTFLFMLPTLIAVAKRFDDVKVYKTGIVFTEWGVAPGPKIVEW